MTLNNIAESVHQLSNDTDPPLKLILQILAANFRKLNVLERYLFKDCVLINELTLPQGTDYLEDEIAFFRKIIVIKMSVSHGCTPPTRHIQIIQNPPAIIVNFLY